MASKPKFPLCQWLSGLLAQNVPSDDVDEAERQLKRIQHDVAFCLYKIGEERVKRAKQERNHSSSLIQVELNNCTRN
jgi:hypothetical protein